MRGSTGFNPDVHITPDFLNSLIGPQGPPGPPGSPVGSLDSGLELPKVAPERAKKNSVFWSTKHKQIVYKDTDGALYRFEMSSLN
jgi:hypothetical protein